MSRIWQCGFEWADTRVFSTVSGTPVINNTHARTGTYALTCTTANHGGTVTLAANKTEIFVRHAIYPTEVIGSPDWGMFFGARDDLGSDHISYRQTATGALGVFRGGTLIATGSVIPINAWTVLFSRIIIDDAPNGIVQVRLNSSAAANDINFSGDTRNAGNANIRNLMFGAYSAVGAYLHIWHDDIAINDTLGTRNNSWVADGGIYPMSPTGAGSHTDWTPSAGANWDNVEEKPPNNDTNYNSESDVGGKDSYEMSNTPGAGTIAAVTYWLMARKEAAGDTVNTQRLLRVGGTDYSGASPHVLSTTYAAQSEILETSPVPPNNPWTSGELDGAEAGAECV